MWTLLVLCSVIFSHPVQGEKRWTEEQPTDYSAQPSCRYNCGFHMGSCSCSSSCKLYGNCCHDYYSYCSYITDSPVETTTDQPSCLYNCGGHMGSCSCSSSCEYNGNCCHDYYSYCSSVTHWPVDPTADHPSCRYNCGGHMGSCSCSSSCEYYGNCCHDYYSYCSSVTHWPVDPTADQPSCLYNCGGHMGSCSCSSSCEYYGNCCHDYYSYCSYTTESPVEPTTDQPSCRNNCGRHMGSCSCTSSCPYYGNCCQDYSSYCSYTTHWPVYPTTDQPSCLYNCGGHMGSCSCSSSCEYYGNCCHDYYSYCYYSTEQPGTASPCGGSLFGSGNFSSPNHPNHYDDNAYCVWYLRAADDHRIFLSFTYLELENCCSCDYISIYDGPSVSSRFLGKVCNDSQSTFYSTSKYMTVVFRTDSSVVGRGFSADFLTSLPPSSGRLSCSSDNMTIAIERSYLSSLGYDGNSLYLNDPNCRPRVNRYQVVFNYPIDTCGNVQKLENGRVVYTNTIRAYTTNYGEITRESYFKLSVGCRMDQDSVAQTMFLIHHRDNSSITGTGKFNTTMDYYTSRNFYNKVTQVPYKVTLNQNMYVQVDLKSHEGNLVLFLDTCVTSPSPHDFTSRPYYLVRNGCTADNTYRAYTTGTRPYAQFTFKAFKFLRASDSVYIQCKVLLCQASDKNSRCRRGCVRRVARDLGSEHDQQTLVLGPIQLKGPEKKEEETQKEDKA
ncbi:CUB and zona pellucida-like domain-containing protein 1 isoform X10 [Labrus bergylta]|uniref:CUB and zona pellucida-like domain-containing protein 1 isoform X10 n=1 Tax=Labrus bergylta TaxID=56723 RepID=UPI00331372BD